MKPWTTAVRMLCLLTSVGLHARAAEAIPDEFRDPETGARIVHVSRLPNDRSGVIYFTEDSTTADSRRVLFHHQFEDKWRHLFTFDLKTAKITPLVTDRLTANQDFSPRTNNVYYYSDHTVWSVNIDTLQNRKIADLPKDWSTGAGMSVNADDTLLAGAVEIIQPTTQAATAPATVPSTQKDLPPETKRLKAMGATFAAHKANLLYTVDLRTGEVKVIHRIDTWLGHIQFSPTDPSLLMYCHEGPWGKVDRIWTIRTGDAEPTLAYPRTEPQEIAGHEFWSRDGKTIWFQDTFRERKESFLAGKDIETGKLTKYRIPLEASAIHQTISPDGKFFIGDGTGKTATGPSKYLTVQVPDGDTLKVTKLCSLQKSDYTQCEPNPHLTDDQHWVIFTASFFGTPQAWALEMPQQYWRMSKL